MAIAVTCSHCQSSFKLAEQMIGKKVKCRDCGNAFLAMANGSADEPAPKEKRIAAQSPLRPVAKRRPERDRDDDNADDRPSRSKRKRKSSGNRALIIGLCAGGGVLLLLVAVGFAVFMFARGRDSRPENPILAREDGPVQARPDPRPEIVPVVSNPLPTAPVNEPAPPPNAPEPEKPAPTAPKPLPADPETTPQPEPIAPKLARGTKVTVRAEIQGSPPDFQGDFNKHVTQNLEIGLRKLGYEPVPDGGLVLQVRAQLAPTTKKISVRTIGAPPPPRPMPKPGVKPGQPATPQPSRDQVYPIENLTTTLVLTDAKGAALWKKDQRFTPHVLVFKTPNPPREMQDQMWRAFDAWARDSAIATLKQ